MDYEDSLDSGPHARLASIVGEWSGTASLWFEPGDRTAIDDITLRAELVADGRSLRMTYSSAMNGTPSSGELLVGHHLDSETWQAAWSDSSHTGTLIMWFEGSSAPNGAPLLEGSYGGGDEVWGWHITFGLDDDELVVSHDNVQPGMDPVPGLVWRCSRVG